MNYTLDALSAIQATEAEPAAQAFRDEYLGGAVLTEDDARAWLAEHLMLGAGQNTLIDAFPYPGEVTYLANGAIRRIVVCWYAHGDGWVMEHIRAEQDSPLERLGSVVADLAHDFGREWWTQGVAFVLSGRPVKLSQVLASEDPPTNTLRRTTGPALSMAGFAAPVIVLRCRMSATDSEVLATYREALNACRHTLGYAIRERNRSLSSERTRDLAVFGARIARGDFPSWGAAMIAYQHEHQNDRTYSTAQHHGKFRRDVRRAFQNVTGSDLTWKPKRIRRPQAAR